MKELRFICAQPDDVYYTWQVHLWLESLRELEWSDKATVLVFTPHFRQQTDRWQKLVDLYPEAEFVFYKDEENEISSKLHIYIPILRPYCLMRYFKDNPGMKDKAVFYCDSDVVFLRHLKLGNYIDDDINYLSDTNSYINASYFDSKIRDVKPEKLDAYKKLEVLKNLMELVGLDRSLADENNMNSGGAQYLLKNIDHTFWEEMLRDTLIIRVCLQNINKDYFESEEKGFQSWCSDMWALLWGLWKRGAKTKVVKEMDFAWSSDRINKLEKMDILHNAGIISENMGGYPAFYKGKYHLGKDPTKDENIYKVYENSESKKYCTHYYVQQLIELKNKYNLNY